MPGIWRRLSDRKVAVLQISIDAIGFPYYPVFLNGSCRAEREARNGVFCSVLLTRLHALLSTGLPCLNLATGLSSRRCWCSDRQIPLGTGSEVRSGNLQDRKPTRRYRRVGHAELSRT